LRIALSEVGGIKEFLDAFRKKYSAYIPSFLSMPCDLVDHAFNFRLRTDRRRVDFFAQPRLWIFQRTRRTFMGVQFAMDHLAFGFFLAASGTGDIMADQNIIPQAVAPAGAAAKRGRAKPFSFHDYAVAIGIALGLTLFFGVYDVYRRGYLFNAPPTADPFFVPNKIIIATGLSMLAFTFLISPLARYFNVFHQMVRYRKEIGIIGGYFALVHAVGSYLWLPLKYPRSDMDFTGVIYSAGLAATIVAVFLLLITSQKAVDLLRNRWWFLHRWGLRFLILFAGIHVYVMKWSHAWVAWWIARWRQPAVRRTREWLATRARNAHGSVPHLGRRHPPLRNGFHF
jgi:DMSO/TMAO reductase YedYZ heme-binding membrane subunit